MDKIYHGCMYKNIDGSNKLYRKSKTCCSGINCPFWKLPWEVKKQRKSSSARKKIGASYFRRIQLLFSRKMDGGKVVV